MNERPEKTLSAEKTVFVFRTQVGRICLVPPRDLPVISDARAPSAMGNVRR